VSSPLSVERHPGTGRPIVFLHGLASRGAQDWPDAEWTGLLAGRPRLVVDLPAHGESPALGTAPTSAVVAALADVAGSEEIDLVGYSLGARLAWDLAQHPSLSVRRLVLGGISPGEPFALVDLAAARRAIDGGDVPGDPLTGMITHMVSLPGNRPAALLDLIEGLAAEPFAPAEQALQMPVLLLGGADDPMSAAIGELAALLPDARTTRVPGDHLTALHTSEFRDAVEQFLAHRPTFTKGNT
jgi:pimeloyl-ACP methyl ester carboxylesterase